MERESALHGRNLTLALSSWRVHTANGSSHQYAADAPVLKTAIPATLTSAGPEVTVYTAPVLGCVDPRSTVGLGDAISAAALVAHFQ